MRFNTFKEASAYARRESTQNSNTVCIRRYRKGFIVESDNSEAPGPRNNTIARPALGQHIEEQQTGRIPELQNLSNYSQGELIEKGKIYKEEERRKRKELEKYLRDCTNGKYGFWADNSHIVYAWSGNRAYDPSSGMRDVGIIACIDAFPQTDRLNEDSR